MPGPCTTAEPDVVVALVDTGTDYTHADLEGRIWVNEDEIPGNGVDDDGNGYIDDVYGLEFLLRQQSGLYGQ